MLSCCRVFHALVVFLAQTCRVICNSHTCFTTFFFFQHLRTYGEVLLEQNVVFSKNATKLSKKGGLSFGGGRTGVIPVKVDMVTSGTRIMFERLLALSEPIDISVGYAKKSEGFMCSKPSKK
eukprot:m.22580 g.22580  ORF g.22580 m.22580 type:complete len:122 (+) comp9243_c0_seq1:1144-1509(+)